MTRNKLIFAAAAGALAAGAAGVLLGQTVFDPHGVNGSAVAEGVSEHAEADHSGAEGVEMSADQVKTSEIQIIEAQAGALSGGIETQGSIAAAPDGLAVLSARSAGSLASIAKRLGDPVERGEVLARIESGEGASLAAALASAQSRAQLARSTFEREKQLYEAKVTARQDFETAQQALTVAEAELASARTAMAAAGVSSDGRFVLVRSPIAGRVISANATLGEFVEPNAELFRVADPAKVHVETSLTAADAARVAPGDPASIIFEDRRLAALVRSITPGLDAESRTATAVLDLQEREPHLQPGRFVRVRISPKATPSRSSVVVPEEAVQSYEGKDVVFVRKASRFEARPVTVGVRSGGQAEILSGVAAGEQLAGKNAFLVKAELGKSEASHED